MTKPEVYAAALYEGTFSVGTDKSFKPIDRDDEADKGALKLSINPFLISTPDKKILIDSGVGIFGPEPHFPIMQQNLARHGLSEDDITDVICSHLHFDHMGGLLHKENGSWELSFPEAKIHLSGNEWDKLKNHLPDDNDRTQFVDYLDVFGDLNLLSDGATPVDGINVEVIGGHTEFSLGIFVEFGEQKYVMAGDVLGTKGAVNRKYAAKYDFDGKQSMKMRKYLTDRAYEEKRVFLTYHETHAPLFRLPDFSDKKGYTIKPVTEYEPNT